MIFDLKMPEIAFSRDWHHFKYNHDLYRTKNEKVGFDLLGMAKMARMGNRL